MGIKNWFKRKEENIIDLRDLQKRGILKENPTESTEQTGSVVDLPQNQNTTDPSSALGFLGNLAGASASSTSSSSVSSSESPLSPQKQRLKGVLRDLRFDIKSASDRIYKLSDRLDLIERKLERLERRAGYSS